MPWWIFALVSALAAAATTVLAKVAVANVPSNLATAVRTSVVVLLAWAVALATREHGALARVPARSLAFLVLSGVGTGVSWLAWFKALELAPASRVAPIDKLSLAFTIVLAAVFLGEAISWKLALGAALMVAGALLTLAP